MIQNKRLKIYAHIVLAVCSAAAILPLLLLFIGSFTDNASALANGFSYFPEKWSFEAYQYIIDEWTLIGKGYANTFMITSVGTALSLIMTSMFAYGLTIRDLPLRRMATIMVIITMLFNGGVVASYFIYSNVFHIRDTYFALLVPNYLMNAFSIILVMNYFRSSVSEELLEAARIDGASEFRIFWKILLPLSKPVLATIGINTAIGYWNDWTNGLYYLSARDGQKYYTIQLILNQINNDVNFLATNAAQMGFTVDTSSLPTTTVRMAIAAVGVLPLLVVYPLFQKYFVKGISIGGVKG
ncbi:MAG: carbohydrate ABC transporter permease [Lachnospiraceae bacterium]|nr:carbohydrate ABC transporter permease [Lachnospiraceae bacterium]